MESRFTQPQFEEVLIFSELNQLDGLVHLIRTRNLNYPGVLGVTDVTTISDVNSCSVHDVDVGGIKRKYFVSLHLRIDCTVDFGVERC